MPETFTESDFSEAFTEADFAEGERFVMEPGMVLPSQVPQPELRAATGLGAIGLTPVGEALGIGRGAEREMQRAAGGAAAVAPQDILNVGFQFLSPPPQIAEPVRAVTEPVISELPAPVAGVATGVREVALGLPWAAAGTGMGTNLGRALLGLFSGEFALSVPERWAQFQEARKKGDDREAARIATETLLTGGLLGLGAKGEIQRGRLEAANRQVSEAAERARQVGLSEAAKEVERAVPPELQEALAKVRRYTQAEQQRPMPTVAVSPERLPAQLIPRPAVLEAVREAGQQTPMPVVGTATLPLPPMAAPSSRLKLVEPAAPAAQPQEINAPIQRIEPGNRVEERVGTGELRPAAEAGGGNRPVEGARVEPAQIPETPGKTGIQAPDRSLLLIDRLANTTGREFEALMQEPGMRGTEAAMRLGQAVRSSPDAPALVERLQQAHEQSRRQSQDARARGDMGEVLALSTKPQYFREALQSATGQTPELVRPVIGEAEAVRPSPESLGIAPPGTAWLQRVMDYFKPRPEEPTPEVRVDATSAVPRLQPYETERRLASTPHGLSRIPILGRLLDPRYAAREPVDQAIIARAYSTSKGQSLAALWAETQRPASQALRADAQGLITLADGAKGYISDVFEAELRNRGSQPLTDAQRDWLWNEYRPVQQDWLAMMRDEGVRRFVDEAGNPVELNDAYFPRTAVGKRAVETGGTGRGGVGSTPGARIQQQKARIFESERAGALSDDGIIYEPDPVKRVAKMISDGYRAVADTRLANDPGLGGETIIERFNALQAQHAPRLRALDQAERAELESQLREQAAHPIWGREAQVFVAPAFTGKIFPIEVARKLQRAYGESSHDWVRKFASATAASKSMVLTADMSGPLTQGLAMAFRNPVQWAKATVNSYRSLLDPNVLSKVMEAPENRQAAQEFVQSGGSLGRLQDFLAGATPGAAATRIPVAGRVIEAAGRAYGTFLDMAKLELWKAWSRGAPKDQWGRLAETVENSVFSGRMEQIGLSPGHALGERLVMLAPSYYRGFAGLASTALQRGVSGKMARQMLASYATGVSLTAVASYLAQGMDWDEIQRRLNPASGKFLKVPVTTGDGRTVEVGLGNVATSAMRLLGDAVEYWNSDSPIDTGVENNPFLRYVRAKSAFLPSVAIDWVTGRDYFGQPIEAKQALVRRFEPLVVQELTHGRGEPGQKLAGAVFSFLGIQSFPDDKRAMWRREQDAIARGKYSKDYSDLSLKQRLNVVRELQQRPELRREPATPREIELAFARSVERRNRLTAALPQVLQQRLSEQGLEVPGYEATLTISGVELPLSEAEVARFQKLLAEEYTGALNRIAERHWLKLQTAEGQKAFDALLSTAKGRARSRLISELSRSDRSAEAQ